MGRRNTCARCAHYTPNQYLEGFGECALIADSNDADMSATDRVYSWDYESYSSGAYVGERFGCIHFGRTS